MSKWIGKNVQFLNESGEPQHQDRYQGKLLWLGVVQRNQGPDWLYAVLMDSNGVLNKENVEGMRLVSYEKPHHRNVHLCQLTCTTRVPVDDHAPAFGQSHELFYRESGMRSSHRYCLCVHVDC